MKKILIVAAVLLPAITIAQGYPGMSEADMQRMMQGMHEVEACMRDIDQARVDALSRRAEQVESEVKALCAKGERDAAEKTGLAFALEVNADPEVQKMRKCSENMRGMMPPMPFMAQADSPDNKDSHICDE